MTDEAEVVVRGELSLALRTDGTGMFQPPFQGDYELLLTGPPGGPLSFLVWKPQPDERGPGGLERSTRRALRLPPELAVTSARIQLAGAERDALCLAQRKGFMQIAWCIAEIEHAGRSVNVAFGCTSGDAVPSCESVLAHPSLQLIASSLRIVP